MNQTETIISIGELNHGRFKTLPFSHDFCITCGLCSSSCPASGIDGFDPRMLVRMVGLGLEDDVVNAKWPWICTMCGKCEHLCPMEIRIPDLVRHIRGLREKAKVPGILQKGLEAALKTGNNLALPKEDFIYIVEDVAGEIAEEPRIRRF